MEYRLIAPIDEKLAPIEQILTNRGFPLEEIYHYLNTTDEDELSPTLLSAIDLGVKVLFKHLNGDKKIYLQVDDDCDGFSSAAILLNYLHNIVPSIVENKIYYGFHSGKGHGIVMENIIDEVGLVIVPDAGSNEYELHEELHNRGIDVLVIDHHVAEKLSDHAIVINNQLSDYPNKALSGGGVVFKFCQHIDKMLSLDYASTYVDLVALSLISDMMDLQQFETRHLIEKGLKSINNPFFSTMIKNSQFVFKDGITPIGIAFYVAPYINAVARIGTEQEKQTLFEAMLTWKAYETIPSTKRGCKGQTEWRVTQAVRNCTNIKKRQTDSRDKNLETIERLINSNNLLDHKVLIVKMPDDSVDPNIIGLMANQLISEYQRPCIILRYNEEENVYTGSLRCPDDVGINDFRAFVEDSGHAIFAQGHPSAAGCAFTPEGLENFITYSDEAFKDKEFLRCYKVDFIFEGAEFKGSDILDIANFKHLWGKNCEEPKVAIENIKVTSDNVQLMGVAKGRPTLRITLANGVSLIKFKSNEEEYKSLFSDSGCVTISVVGTCERNEYFNTVTPQITIENYDIVNRQLYYF